MGNDVKSRLHLKKHDHAGKDGDAAASSSTKSEDQVDKTVMSGTNRARAAQTSAEGAAAAPPSTGGRNPEPANPTTTARGRN